MVETLAVGAAELLLQRSRAGGDGVENAASGAEVLHLLLHGGRIARDEERLENLGCAALGGQHHAAAGEGERLVAAFGNHERQRGDAGLEPDLFGGKLVQRDAVAKRGGAGMRSAGEEGRLRTMPAADFRQRGAAEDGELLAEILERFEIRRERVVAPGGRGVEVPV